MKLWHDDIRIPPRGWDCWVRTNDAARQILDSFATRQAQPFGVVEAISIDHDLGLELMDPTVQDADLQRGPDREDDGLALARWMVEPVLELAIDRPLEKVAKSAWRRVPNVIIVHSMNPVGAQNIVNVFKQVNRTVLYQPYSCEDDNYMVGR
jgi:hypothetical protein